MIFRIVIVGKIVDQHIRIGAAYPDTELQVFDLLRNGVDQLIAIPLRPGAVRVGNPFLAVGVIYFLFIFVQTVYKHTKAAGYAVSAGNMGNKLYLISEGYRDGHLTVQEGKIQLAVLPVQPQGTIPAVYIFPVQLHAAVCQNTVMAPVIRRSRRVCLKIQIGVLYCGKHRLIKVSLAGKQISAVPIFQGDIVDIHLRIAPIGHDQIELRLGGRKGSFHICPAICDGRTASDAIGTVLRIAHDHPVTVIVKCQHLIGIIGASLDPHSQGIAFTGGHAGIDGNAGVFPDRAYHMQRAHIGIACFHDFAIMAAVPVRPCSAVIRLACGEHRYPAFRILAVIGIGGL